MSDPRPTTLTLAPGVPVPGLNSWVLERKLGGGGFGQVWLARHAVDARQPPRAVKFCTDPVARHRLVTHERNVVARVMRYAGEHPNLVPLREYNLDGAVPWLMFDYVAGGTLADLIDQWETLPVPKRLGRALKVLHGVASGLAACHRLDPPLVHRDMKPQNVLMDGAVPKVTDFGIGSVSITGPDAGGSDTVQQAQAPSLLRAAGTRAYAPPEQMLGAAPHPREDVYALGVMAYQLVVGDRLAGPGTDAADELRELKAPRELIDLIVRSVAVKPDRRPQDAGEWVATLDALLTRSRSPAEATGSASPSRPGVILESPQQSTVRQWEQATERESRGLNASHTKTPIAKRLRRKPRHRNWVALGGVGLLVALLMPALWFALRPAPNGGSAAGSAERPQDKDAGRTKQGVAERAKDDVKGSTPPVVPKGLGLPVVPKVTRKQLTLAEQFPANPNPGQECDIEIAAGVRMRFCWVPGGEYQLGSPKGESTYSDEAEEVRGKFRTPGFWLGKYEVTQAEWAAVMRGTKEETPSEFRVGGKSAGALGTITDTSRFPVENVSWNIVCEPDGFLDRANAFARGVQADVRSGRLCLPHEDEWEYACRGGLGNERPFYFGASCNGAEANCDGNNPFGTMTKGSCLRRTTTVGTYEGKAPHPWGLCDMHGNVWEWCKNPDSKTKGYMLRGGGWIMPPVGCRAAIRIWGTPESRNNYCGFRVCFRLD